MLVKKGKNKVVVSVAEQVIFYFMKDYEDIYFSGITCTNIFFTIRPETRKKVSSIHFDFMSTL